jgi:hypothetical protein
MKDEKMSDDPFIMMPILRMWFLRCGERNLDEVYPIWLDRPGKLSAMPFKGGI